MNGLDTINTAKQHFRDGLEKGIICPCCNRFAKIYRRTISNSMSMGLTMIFNQTIHKGQVWIHIERFFKSENCSSAIRGDFPKLKHWNLIEAHPESLGFYRITEKGKDFVSGRISVPKTAFIFNDEVQGFSTEEVKIIETIKEHFDFEVLMQEISIQRKLDL